METKTNLFQKIINILLKYGFIIIAMIIFILGICSIFITAFYQTTYNSAPETTIFKFSFGIIEFLLSVIYLYPLFYFFCSNSFFHLSKVIEKYL